jgi:tripartite-type tricarboxylate transporter receptor subunit TctC
MEIVMPLKSITAIALAMLCGLVRAQPTYPVKPVKMIVAFTAGSETDYLARIVSQKLSERWGQQVVVENRPGAGGVLAAGLVAGAPADGYTLLTHSMAHAIAPAVHVKLPYDPLRDLAPVSQIAGVPNVLVIAPGQGMASVKDLIALARQRPGQLTFGSAGIGSGMHINGEQFRLAAEIEVTHVAYKGGPEALTDLLGGRISYVFSPIGIALPLVKENKLIALGVTPAVRSPALPEVPTIAEAGVPGFEFDTWYGIFAPGKTPRGIVTEVSAEVARVAKLPDVQERFAARGAVPKFSSPEAFDRFVRSEMEKLAKVIKAAGVKPG